ncbi:MAG: helicase C-terminal domain-containing protein [Candidatus Gracilibacteria bacterium]|nr:helicase C-terminal domain-containing protein [Candidatus Gracilibacteria bacterium]
MIVALDLETTGLDNNFDKIIEIALVKFNPITFEIIEKFDTLINPGIEIPELTSNITNIFNKDVENAPTFDYIKDKVIEFIGDLPILGHNVYFDKDFLVSYGIPLGNNITLDTFLLSNIFFRYEKSLSLESLSSSFNLDLEGAHRALNDTIATLKLFKLIIDKTKDLNEQDKKIFSYILSKSEDSGFRFILDNYVDKKEKNIDKTKFLKLFFSNFPDKKEYIQLMEDKDIKIKDFRQIMSKIENIEPRENQEIMYNEVLSSLDNNKKLAIEAPTGVGKTFAYLLPSILYSIKNGEQVYITTSTKALQDQIYYKDLKFFKNNLEYDFTYTKLKGKRNYLGIYTFLRFFDEEEFLSKEKTSFLLKTIYWVFDSEEYELDELDYYGSEYSFLREINADDKVTFSAINMYEDREPAVRARRNARGSNIVIINNNILFQDIDGENNILGKVKNLIIDESHNLEDVVTNTLKKGFSIKDLEKTFSIVDNSLKKHKFIVDNYNQKVDSLLFDVGSMFDVFGAYLSLKVSEDSKYKTALIKSDFFNSNIDNVDIASISLGLRIKLTELIDNLLIVPEEIYMHLSKEISHLEMILDIIGVVLDKNSINKFISIISYTENKGFYLEYTLLSPGEYLINNLWNKLNSCILTSATLKINDSFDYISNILGLEGFDFKSLQTDFDYSKQALLYVPDDLGSIKNNMTNIVNFLHDFFMVVKGSTLVLFTAFFAIKEVYSKLNIPLKKEGITLYAQGIGGGKHKLLDFYKSNHANSVLLGTDTFWEGVDISGEKLKYLIIHKVPFMVPSDPIFQARSILFKNAFADYSLPKAIIKLKQGFGRLIRTKEDSGIVVFLDDRIYSTNWGEALFGAFPVNIKYKKGSSNGLLEVLKKN